MVPPALCARAHPPCGNLHTPEPERDYSDAAIRTAVQIHLNEEEGDILLFLTVRPRLNRPWSRSRSSVPTTQSSGQAQSSASHCTRLYRPLSSVCRAHPSGTCKIVVSTNIAETSLTIDGIVYVIDPGFSKQKVYNPRIRVESLLVSPISRASSRQRSGRAGRTRPGKACLFTERTFKTELQEQTYPRSCAPTLGRRYSRCANWE